MTDDLRFEAKTYGRHEAGPRLLITAGIHGDEYLPMLAVRELVRQFESSRQLTDRLCGSITLIPIVNQSAFRLGQRVGEDGKDLARTFPGSPDGTVTDRIAHELSHEISQSDFYVDLHTGGTELCVAPLAGYMLHDDTQVRESQRKLAMAFGLPLVWGTSAHLQGRSLSVARDAGVPAIYVEYLGAHRERLEIEQRQRMSNMSDHTLVTGCLNVMRHLRILEPSEQSRAQHEVEVIEDWRTDSGHMQVANPSPATGFLNRKVELGQHVSPGALIAEIESHPGQQKHFVMSQQDGKVVVLRECPRVNAGDSVAVIAESWEAP